MEFSLSGEQQALRTGILANLPGSLADDIRLTDCRSGATRRIWQELGISGLHGLPVPAEYGGSGHGPLATVIALQAYGHVGRGSGLVAAAIRQLLSCTIPVWLCGDEEQRADLLPALCRGARIACSIDGGPAIEEGADRPRITVTGSGKAFLLNTPVPVAAAGPLPDLLLLTVTEEPSPRSGNGMTFIIERGMHGVEITETASGSDGPPWHLGLSGLELSTDNLLGRGQRPRTGHDPAQLWDRTCSHAGIIGATGALVEQVLRHATAYTRRCKLKGQPSHGFQSVSHSIAELKTHLDIAELLLYEAAWCLENTGPAGYRAALANVFTGETLMLSTVQTVNALLGFGLRGESEALHALLNNYMTHAMRGLIRKEKNIIARQLELAGA